MSRDFLAVEGNIDKKPGAEVLTPVPNRLGGRNSNNVSPYQNYIEKDFPVEHLTPIVTKEANSKSPVYQIHKWWARRLGSVFRMLLVTSFTDSRETYRNVWAKYMNGGSLHDKVILDPMMGGGTTIVEALKLGGKVIGLDINPVAWFVTKKEVEPLDVTKVQESFQTLEKEIGKVITRFYETKCESGHNAGIMYALWHKQIVCRKCNSLGAVLQNYVISEKKKLMVIFCPSCESIFSRGRNIKSIVTCPACHHRFNPRTGTSQRGTITCPKCEQKEAMTEAVRRNGGSLNLKMFCVEYYCADCGRGYKRPSNEDIERYHKAETLLAELDERLQYPKEVIPCEAGNARPGNHGYRFFYQLFNPRQLLCLSLLLKGILKLPDRNTREFMLLVFSSCLETNNIFCKYETKWQKASAMFGIPGYHPVDRIAENNTWGTKYGRGTFLKCYHKLLKAKSKAQELNKARLNSGNGTSRNWFTYTTESLPKLESESKALLVCKNSESMSFIPSNSIDLIATDPPYFDNLNYSRLADFFYVWLRIGLMDDYECFRPTTSARERELVMDGTTRRTADELVEALTNIFRECYRVLKPRRLMVFTFHHTKRWAWQGLMKAIRAGGFSVVASHFIRSEGRTGFRKSGNISYDVCIVCRKAEEIATEDRPQMVLKRSENWIRRLIRSGNGLQDSDVHSIMMGNLLTYAPNLVLDGFVDNKWFNSMLEKCLHLKNELEVKYSRSQPVG